VVNGGTVAPTAVADGTVAPTAVADGTVAPTAVAEGTVAPTVAPTVSGTVSTSGAPGLTPTAKPERPAMAGTGKAPAHTGRPAVRVVREKSNLPAVLAVAAICIVAVAVVLLVQKKLEEKDSSRTVVEVPPVEVQPAPAPEPPPPPVPEQPSTDQIEPEPPAEDEAEKQRLADEAERQRKAAEEAEKQRLAEEARKAEEARLAEEARKAEEARRKAEEAERQRIAEEKRKAEEAEKQRLAEEARKAEEKRQNDYDALKRKVDSIASKAEHDKAAKAVREKVDDQKLPESWRAKYREIAAALAKKFSATLTNDSGIEIDVGLDGTARRKRLIPGEKWVNEFDAWSGTASFSAVPANHPEDYEGWPARREIAIGKAGGAKPESIGPRAFTQKPLPVVVVKNAGEVDAEVDAEVSVDGGASVVVKHGVVKQGESGPFKVEPREKVHIAAEASGAPELLKSVYGVVETNIVIGARGTTNVVDISVRPDWNKLGKVVVNSVEEKDAVLGFAKEPVARESLKTKVNDLHAKQFESLKQGIMGEPETWKDAKNVTGTFSPYILGYSLLLGLDPTPDEIKEAKFIKDNMETSKKIMEFFNQSDDRRARWSDFTNALERAETARRQD
ncbi:MAG: hypothetical protein IJ678_02160, partial [Kiritimatiellae bacterium]|nr:hypothetical protein [Kiritimatiellia bacterium]